MFGSSLGFLRMGVMAASLNDGGTQLLDREEFMIEAVSGERTSRQALMRVDGTGSNKQVDGLMPSSSSGRWGRSGRTGTWRCR